MVLHFELSLVSALKASAGLPSMINLMYVILLLTFNIAEFSGAENLLSLKPVSFEFLHVMLFWLLDIEKE